MFRYIKRLFAWWDGATIGAFFDILRRGKYIGKDLDGNRYYQERRASLEGRRRRWVIYNGYAEASRVSADWHGWLHYIFEEPPTEKPFQKRDWEKEHSPNLTGTPYAYHPKGSLNKAAERNPVESDYEAWSPEKEE